MPDAGRDVMAGTEHKRRFPDLSGAPRHWDAARRATGPAPTV